RREDRLGGRLIQTRPAQLGITPTTLYAAPFMVRSPMLISLPIAFWPGQSRSARDLVMTDACVRASTSAHVGDRPRTWMPIALKKSGRNTGVATHAPVLP